jgi:hypothetical protein
MCDPNALLTWKRGFLKSLFLCAIQMRYSHGKEDF